MTLSEFLRANRFTGTKVGCGEGGCGACAVMISAIIPGGTTVEHRTVNACLRLLVACDGVAVTTPEGIRRPDGSLHPIQQRVVDYNGSQCGFCTPGMVMAMYGSLARGDTTADKLEQCLDGNLCRCTGYRPLLDAAKSCSSDGHATVQDQVNQVAAVGPVTQAECTPVFPAFLREANYGTRALRFCGADGRSWHRPTGLAGVQALIREHGTSMKVMVGNTSVGVYKEHNSAPKIVVDISRVPELNGAAANDGGVWIGAATTIAVFGETLEAMVADPKRPQHETAAFQKMVAHSRRIAGWHVRNAGSIGGNLMLAKTRAFESDLATILIGVGAKVRVAYLPDISTAAAPAGRAETEIMTMMSSHDAPTEMPLLKFFEGEFPEGTLLTAVFVPLGKEGEFFRSYKVARRPQNEHALVNAAFRVRLEPGPPSAPKISDATIVFGAIDTATAIRAPKTEAVLNAGAVDSATLQRAVRTLVAEVAITAADAEHRSARNELIKNLCYKFFLELAEASGITLPLQTASAVSVQDGGSGGRQDVNMDNAEHDPVARSIPNRNAPLQATGTAIYSADVRLPSDTLYAAYAQTTEARAKIVTIDAAAALALPGVVRFLDARSIPGENSLAGFDDEEVFATYSHFVGQPVGIVLATSELQARLAARLVVCSYERDDGAPILTNDEARARGSYFEGMKRHHKRGFFELAVKLSDQRLTGRMASKSQSHFYMEPQNAFAIPDEDGTFQVGSSMQYPDGVQGSVAKALAVDYKDVNVTCRRVGGGFGGKLTRHIPIAVAAAVGAKVTGKPVRFVLDRNTDMRITGGRHAVDADFEVGYKLDGTIEAMKLDVYMNSGFCKDISDFCVMSLARSVDQIYRIPNFEVICHATKTNLPTRTAMRGPGEIQSSFVIEDVLEKVATAIAAVTKEPATLVAQKIRTANMYPANEEALVTQADDKITLMEWTMPGIWDRIQEQSKFGAVTEEVDAFNAANLWKKQGVAITPVKYKVGAGFMTALVNVYKDGSVLVSHSGMEIGQGIHTKVIQAAAYALSKLGCQVPMEMIRIEDSNTSIIPGMQMTGGSTTSERSCAAVMACCDQLVERLQASFDTAKTKGVNVDEVTGYDWEKEGGDEEQAAAKTVYAQGPGLWKAAIKQAMGNKVNLSSQSGWQPDGLVEAASYHNFGAAFCHVELDVLTGKLEILRTDMVYDCGKSLNPSIDLGQVEGGFMTGIGFYFREDLAIADDGTMDSDGTWKYKIPCSADVPKSFNVAFLKETPFKKGILSSKASGEPPLVLSTAAFMAARHAVAAVRADRDLSPDFDWDAPATLNRILDACGPVPMHLIRI